MESLKLKIIEGYIFNEDEAKKSQCIVEKITELPTRSEGPPKKLQKIQVPDKSEWSPLKLPGIPDLGDKNMKFPVKSVKEKITKLFPIEPLTPSPEWSSEKLHGSPDLENEDFDYEEDSENEDTNSFDNENIFGPDLRNQPSHIPGKSGNVEEILEMFHAELWGARTFKDELELIRKKFRKCRFGM